MKRTLTLLVTIGIMFGLVACGGDDEETLEPNETEDNTATEEKVDEEAVEEPEETEKEIEEPVSETETNSEITDFEEASTIEAEIDVSDLDVEIETDNQNNRVILFKDGDKAVYKTIFVKNDKRLKIIDIIDNEGQVYNETIK